MIQVHNSHTGKVSQLFLTRLEKYGKFSCRLYQLLCLFDKVNLSYLVDFKGVPGTEIGWQGNYADSVI